MAKPRKKKRTKPERTQAQQIALGIRLMSKAMLSQAKAEAVDNITEPFCLLIDDIKLLKLSAFITCFVSNDYTGLILAGEPNTTQLAAAWEALKLQYYDATANSIATQANERQKLMNTYALFINRVRFNMEALSAHYHEALIDELREDGFDYLFTPETLTNDLQCIANELTGWEVKKEQLEKEELEATERNGSSRVELSEEYFLEQLAELRKFEGFNTPVTRLAQEMTVYDYCVSVKRYTQHIQQLQTQRTLQDGNG